MPTTNLRNSTHVTGTAPDNTMTIDTPNAVPAIVADKWIRAIKEKRSDKEKKDKEVETAQVKGNVKISLETQNVADDTELTISLLDAGDNSELTTVKVKLKKNKGDTENIEIKNDWYNKELIVSVTKDNNSNLGETYTGTKKLKISCCEHAIVRGDEGDLIKEINIRLAGFGEFGCPLPQSLFDERTEKAVKQFQRDYMKVNPTGIICKNFLEKLDQFCEDYYMKIDTDANFKVKCPCVNVKNKSDHHCTTGFGKGRTGNSLSYTHKYNDGLEDRTREQSYGGTEKPGIHRSLLWAISAIAFYLDKIETSENLKLGSFHSSYRCKGDNIDKFKTVSYVPKQYHPEPHQTKEKLKPNPRTSSNHMGNAIDIHAYPKGQSSGNTRENADIIRKLFVKYSGALIRWPQKDVFCLEPSKNAGDDFTAGNWAHIDCREFADQNKDNVLYCKNETELKSSKFEDLYSSETCDEGKWVRISDCAYSPTVQAGIPARVDEIWLGILNLPAPHAGKAICLESKDDKQVWTATGTTGNSKKRNQCVVVIHDESNTEYEIQPKGTSEKGWIDKKWIIEVVKYQKKK